MLYLLFRILRRLLRLQQQFLAFLRPYVTRGRTREHMAAVRSTATAYDMVAQPDEKYYVRQYLHWLEPCLPKTPSRLLDLGCGHGRLTIPLAQRNPGYTMVAVDFAPEVTQQAHINASAAGVQERIQIVNAEAGEFLRQQPGNSFEVVLALEIYYMLAEPAGFLDECFRVLKRGGLLAISVRPRWFYLAHGCQLRRLELLDLVSNRSGGTLGSDSVHLTWWDPEAFQGELLRVGFSQPQAHGIGCLSGIPGDPHETVAHPAELDETEQEWLLQTELRFAADYLDASRYLFFTTIKEH